MRRLVAGAWLFTQRIVLWWTQQSNEKLSKDCLRPPPTKKNAALFCCIHLDALFKLLFVMNHSNLMTDKPSIRKGAILEQYDHTSHLHLAISWRLNLIIFRRSVQRFHEHFLKNFSLLLLLMEQRRFCIILCRHLAIHLQSRRCNKHCASVLCLRWHTPLCKIQFSGLFIVLNCKWWIWPWRAQKLASNNDYHSY